MTGRGLAGTGCAAILLALLLAGCGGPSLAGSSATGSVGTPTPEETFATPSQEPSSTTFTTSTKADATPAVKIARLPIGGSAQTDADDPRLQCVDVSWSVSTVDVPSGYSVRVTRAFFSGPGFTALRSSCGGAPTCVGYVMRVGRISCSIAVRSEPTADPDAAVAVRLAGTVFCPSSVGVDGCRRFRDLIASEVQKEIPLEPPPATTQSDPGLTTESGASPSADPSSSPLTETDPSSSS